MIIIPRAAWGAKYLAGFGPAPRATELWLHHSDTNSPGPDAPLTADIATVQLLERIGQERFGGGISYTYAVAQSGRVFEGTGPLRLGAHTKGHNTAGRAVVLIGDYMKTRPTDAQLDAVAELVRTGRAAGWWTVDRLTGGHRDASGASTSCPGDAAWATIPTINSRALHYTAQQEAPDMDQDQDAWLRRVEAGLTTILQQLAGPGATLDNPWPGDAHGGGWPHFRYNNPTPARFTVVDLLRSIDRQVNSGLDLTGRPHAPGNLDDAFGQVLSARAEILDGLDELRALLAPSQNPGAKQ
jgi:N-acetylmuramoyl-L-alanine amidase